MRASYRDGVLTVRLPKVEAEAEGDQDRRGVDLRDRRRQTTERRRRRRAKCRQLEWKQAGTVRPAARTQVRAVGPF